MDLKELDKVNPNEHWYYQAKLKAVMNDCKKLTKSPKYVIDVGAGSGFFSASVSDLMQGDFIECVDPNYELDFIKKQKNMRMKFTKTASTESVADADLFLFIDVLEHVEDDLLLLTAYTLNAKKGALVIISVPAFQSLWSYHDEFLEHFKRYRLNEVVALCQSANLEVLHRKYLFGVIFPFVWLYRKLNFRKNPESDMKPMSKILNFLLLKIGSFENSMEFNRFFGLSAYVVAKVK
jgi:2-polyprenyl-3-methyl-5-hydroxy-6-metoxy-1,4-benzoquinol methylase